MNPSDPSSNDITRRNFMKKSALTVGAITLLSQGISLANGGPYGSSGNSGGLPPARCPSTTCNDYRTDGLVYTDKNDATQFFTVGACVCKSGGQEKRLFSWEAATKIPDAQQQVWVEMDERDNHDEHTALHTLKSHVQH